MMRAVIALLLAFVLTSAVHPPPSAAAPGTAAPNTAVPPEPSIDDVLDALDRCGQDLAGFDASVKLTETDNQLQSATTRTGKVWLQKKGPNDARLRVMFDKTLEEKNVRNEKIEYMLDGAWLIERDYKKHNQTRRQVLRPGEKINLFKLGEGPFPMPIGQKKEDVKKQFEVRKAKPARDDPPGTVHIILKPLAGTPLAKKVGMLDVWVDMKSQMPVRIDTLDPRQTTTRSTEFSAIRRNPNPPLGDADFTLPKIDESQWNIHDEPFAD
jgi:outer membrane lipoprotein-sorting protein